MTDPAPQTDRNDPPIVQIYNKINDLFGHKEGQLFTMEFPGRILDMGTYQYDASGTDNAQQTKPQTVAEAEFKLSDDLYTLAQLTGGTKGTKLSEAYDEVINTLLPASSSQDTYSQKILPDQLVIEDWLLELVPDWQPPSEDILADLPAAYKDVIPKSKTAKDTPNGVAAPLGKIPRVDLYQKLTDAYENERFRWEQFKLNARPADDKDRKAWDLYNRTLAAFAPTIDKKLEGLWTTLIVRGQYHRVRHYVGLIDVETGSETLLKAKESLRASVMRSLDDAEDIYPVQFSPASWANYLSTDFTPVDLLMSPALLRQQMIDKQDQRQQLLVRLGQLQSAQVDIASLQKEADAARAAFDAANNAMVKGFSDTAISLIQMYFKSRNQKKQTELTDAEKGDISGVLEANMQPPLTDAQFQQLKDMQGKAIENQTTFLNASEAVARSQAALAGGIASDPKLAIAQVQGQIDQLTSAIETLKSILDSSTDTADTGYDTTNKKKLDAPPVPTLTGALPPVPIPKTGASEWESITITYDHSKATSDSSLSTSATHSSWSVSLFFGSGGQSSDASSSSKASNMTTDKTDVKVGFNVMKVEITRPWLDASVLAQTKDYYRMSPLKISKGPGFLNTLNSATAKQADKDGALQEAERDTLLPAFPVAFIVAKDVTMTLSNNFAGAGDASSYMEKTSSSGGGILCFSISRSSHETHSTQSAYSEADDKHINIRIPGPQIIGWIMQTVPEDHSTTTYDKIDRGQFKLDVDSNKPGGSTTPPSTDR